MATNMALAVNGKKSTSAEDNKRSFRFKFNRHTTMERLCFLLVVFVVAFGSLYGVAIYEKIDRSRIRLTEDVIYGSYVNRFSVSNTEVRTVGVWRNSDYTKATILLHVEEGMRNLSTDAADYDMFMTGLVDELKSVPKGSIYVFGNTGYIALGFVDSAGLESAAYDIYLRNKSYYTNTRHDAGDDSNNLLRLGVNFGANTIQEARFYLNPSYTAKDIYAELVQEPRIASQKSACMTTIYNINNSMRRANEYARRLDSAGIVMDFNLPYEIYGDSVSYSPDSSSPVYFDFAHMINMQSGRLTGSEGRFGCVDVDHDVVTQDVINESIEDVSTDVIGAETTMSLIPLYYHTDYVFPGGVNYDCSTFTSETDVLGMIIPADSNYVKYVEKLRDETAIYTTRDTVSFGDYIDSRNGVIVSKNNANDLAIADALESISEFESEIRNVYSMKKRLQCEQLVELLGLYYEFTSVDSFTSVNTSDGVLTVY